MEILGLPYHKSTGNAWAAAGDYQDWADYFILLEILLRRLTGQGFGNSIALSLSTFSRHLIGPDLVHASASSIVIGILDALLTVIIQTGGGLLVMALQPQ